MASKAGGLTAQACEKPSESGQDRQSGENPSSNAMDGLTDLGKYSFVALVANLLAELYEGKSDQEFLVNLITELMTTIQLPEHSHAALLSISRGEYQVDKEPFIDALLQEEVVKEHPDSLLTSLLLAAIKNGRYDSRARVLLEHLSWVVRVEMSDIEQIEEGLLDVLKQQGEQTEEDKKAAEKKSKRKKIKRGILIGLATVIGGTVVGVTGGLAAPLLAAGIGAVIGTAGGAALGSVAGVAIIGSLFGVAGAGLTGYKMKKRVGGIEQFEFDVLSEGHSMCLTIAVSGWVTNTNDGFRRPWLSMDHSHEQYYLKWEGSYLQELGHVLDTLQNLVVKSAITESLKYTALSTILGAIAWPSALLSVASVIDNPWNVCTSRAENTGKHLAEVLITRQQGHRPVTLIGFSLGARVLYYCLQELAKSDKGQGIIENVYLLGAPVTGNPKEWAKLENVVAGKIVNAYIRSDWMLKFLYRTASVQLKIAGLAPVQWDNRRMFNIDLTHVVNGHMDYMRKMGTVLDAIGVKTKESQNVFIKQSTTEDSGISTMTGNTDNLPLLNSRESSYSDLQSTLVNEPPRIEQCEDPITTPYNRLQDLRLSDIKSDDSGLASSSTESEQSIRIYQRLHQQESSDDTLLSTEDLAFGSQPDEKTVITPKPAKTGEKLLGSITLDKILDSSSELSAEVAGLSNPIIDGLGSNLTLPTDEQNKNSDPT